MADLVRRPLRSRDTKWASAIAGRLTRSGIRPNQISIFSVIFAALAGICLVIGLNANPAGRAVLSIVAAVFIQLRLLCNLFDGMVAVEGGLKTKSGEIFNELPDRLADPLILVGAGYSTTAWLNWGSDLGWAAGLLAVLTAYIRVLGASAGARQYFTGPMAKQQRMAVMTVACAIAAVEALLGWEARVMAFALALIILGCIVTIVRRTILIIKDLESR